MAASAGSRSSAREARRNGLLHVRLLRRRQQREQDAEDDEDDEADPQDLAETGARLRIAFPGELVTAVVKALATRRAPLKPA